MKVKQLIKLLSKQDPDRLVVLASDMEGNSFDTLSDVEPYAYNAERQEIGIEKKMKGYDDEVMTDGVPALVLWP